VRVLLSTAGTTFSVEFFFTDERREIDAAIYVAAGTRVAATQAMRSRARLFFPQIAKICSKDVEFCVSSSYFWCQKTHSLRF